MRIALLVSVTALLAAAAAGSDMFGLCVTPYWPDVPGHGVCYTSEMASDIRNLGAGWMRCEFLCKRDGTMDYEGWNEVLSRAREHGLNVIGLLDYSTLSGPTKSDWATPDYAERFARRAAQIANRYKNCVQVWEIWNEPNLPDFRLDPEPYGRLLAATYRAIKSVDNRAVICAAGLAGCWSGEDSNQAKQYLEELYQSEGCQAFRRERGFYPFDAVADHPYAWDKPPSKYMEKALRANILAVMERFGDGSKPIYLTEVGWDVDPASPTKMGLNLEDNEINQAKWIAELYRLAPTWKRADGSPLLKCVCLYCYQAPGGFGVREFGSDRKRPSYDAYRNAAGAEVVP